MGIGGKGHTYDQRHRNRAISVCLDQTSTGFNRITVLLNLMKISPGLPAPRKSQLSQTHAYSKDHEWMRILEVKHRDIKTTRLEMLLLKISFPYFGRLHLIELGVRFSKLRLVLSSVPRFTFRSQSLHHGGRRPPFSSIHFVMFYCRSIRNWNVWTDQISMVHDQRFGGQRGKKQFLFFTNRSALQGFVKFKASCARCNPFGNADNEYSSESKP